MDSRFEALRRNIEMTRFHVGNPSRDSRDFGVRRVEAASADRTDFALPQSLASRTGSVTVTELGKLRLWVRVDNA